LWDSNGSSARARIAGSPGINHGIVVHDNYLYASNQTALVRWRYTGQRTDLGTPQIVISGMPTGGHFTRTPFFDNSGLLYISIGAGSNVDPNSNRARIRRFDITTVPSGGINFNTGFVFADGLRNEVGLALDNTGRMWGVENGVDNLNRPDLGGDIHNDNPAEEVNLFAEPGLFYGYPYCWSEYSLPPQYAQGKGAQWAHPNFMNDGVHTDTWCRNRNNVVPPAYAMGAHQAPLDIKFYYGNSFPAQYKGGAFVSLHGSWDRVPPQGYRVIHIQYNNGNPVSESVLLAHSGSNENWPNNFRPVGLSIGTSNGADCLFISSDGSGQIIKMTYSNAVELANSIE
jgi:glucose/arabinose dehydrogenase